MATFATSGAAASSVARSAQRSAVMLQRLLPQAGEATLRLPLPCQQPGRLAYTASASSRRQLCSIVACSGRRDMSAHAAAVSCRPSAAALVSCCRRCRNAVSRRA